jgi:sulfoxide reductase catalytic subunit YedY
MRTHHLFPLVFIVVLATSAPAGLSKERTVLEPGTSEREIVHMHPRNVDPSLLPLDSVEDLHVTGVTPEVDLNSYRLTVSRNQEELLSLPFRHLTKMDTVEKKVILICPG